MLKEEEQQKIKRQADNVPCELSFGQEQLWLIHELNPQSAAYNMPKLISLKGQLDLNALEKTLNSILARHEILRTNYLLTDGVPKAFVRDASSVNLQMVDLSVIASDEREKKLYEYIYSEVNDPFDLEEDLMLRCCLYKLDVRDHMLLITVHHIACDGKSGGLWMNEIVAHYSAFINANEVCLPELPIQYSDYARWQREQVSLPEMAAQLKYWIKNLKGIPEKLKLPENRPRPKVKNFHGASYSRSYPFEKIEAFSKLARKECVTPFLFLFSVFNALIFRYTQENDIVIGCPVSTRSKIETENLIGFFINMIAIRIQTTDRCSFRQILSIVKEQTLDAHMNSGVPFEKLVKHLNPGRKVNQNPIFQIIFNHFLEEKTLVQSGGLRFERVSLNRNRTPVDQYWNVGIIEKKVHILVEYDTDLFNSNTIDRMANHYLKLLDSVLSTPDIPIADISIVETHEMNRLLFQSNETFSEYPRNKCIHELFEVQVEKTLDATAVVFKEEALTYQQLNERANQLAHHLIRLGVGPETLVGLCLDRSLDLIVGILGILKAGGAYVPLDISHPSQRLEFILEDAQVNYLLTHPELREQLPASVEHTILLTAENEAIANSSKENLPCRTKPDQLAYTMYTSGSTGQPKGVQIPHAAVVNFLTSMAVEPGLTAKDRLLSVTTPTFDISVLELLLPLTVGASVDIVSSELTSDAAGLANRLTQTGATVMQATPATWQMLIQAGWEGASNLKVLCGGEALSDKLATELLPRCGELWNMYGPTETTIWSTCLRVQDGGTHGSIGRPIANTQTYLLDKNRQLVPVGVPGELYISGAGLARGYLNRPDLTAEKFVSHTFGDGPGTRLYRTGDLCKWHEDGTLEFLGRIDHQVKVRGFRIELGEIEAVLDEHPEISQSVVIVHEGQSGDNRLVAYLKPATDTKPKVSELRSHLSSKLPDYMIPVMYVMLKSFPLNPNGKIDRKKLEQQKVSFESFNKYIAPRNETEQKLATIWKEILKIEQVGIHDNFFGLGGHSLLAIQLQSRIRDTFEVDIPIRDLFEFPTIEKLSGQIDALLFPDAIEGEREQGTL